MTLSELPRAIKDQSVMIQQITEVRDCLLNQKKRMDIEIERKVQSLDSKLVKNENQRDIARFDFRSDAYNSLLDDLAKTEHELAVAKIHLQYLRDMFAVEKIENQGAIAAAYV